jgi:hypothetical protein
MDMQESSLRMKLNNQVIDEETASYSKCKLAECYEKIVMIINEYMDVPQTTARVVALWIISTYFHESFQTFPYLFFNAMRGSGKTRFLKLISSLASKGDGSVQNNLTEAVLFRIPRGTTTCIDEVEQIGSKEKQTLRELLNSAYKKGMKVKRMRKSHTKDGEMQVVETFEPYFPIAMANIWGMDEVLSDRSLTFILEKSNNPLKTKMIEDFENNYIFQEIKTTLNSLVGCSLCSVVNIKNIEREWNKYIKDKYTPSTLTTYTTLTTLTTPLTKNNEEKREEMEKIRVYLDVEEFFNKLDSADISGRNFELSLPLLIISKTIGDEYFTDFIKIMKEVIVSKKGEEYANSKDVSLYEMVNDLESFGLEYFPIKELTQRFREFVGDDSEKDDKWLNDKWMGRALKRLNLELEKKRFKSGFKVILNYVKAKEKLKIFKSDSVDSEKKREEI